MHDDDKNNGGSTVTKATNTEEKTLYAPRQSIDMSQVGVTPFSPT